MKINFFRGTNHEVRFRFPKYEGTIEQVYLTVKCTDKIVRLQKKLNDGIELIDGWYVVSFVPEDTEEISCILKMTYDIKIITGNKKFIVAKDCFKLEEEVTTSKDEV